MLARRMLLVWCMAGPLAAAPSPAPQEQTLNAEISDAIAQVNRIVNQPVTPLLRDPGARVATFSPGWFHEGAQRPDFASVDVRKTQQFPYDRYEFVTSNLNPGMMFRGRDLEFNAMTKYFYTDRSLPKKRLTEEEMVEVNRLYRIIGRDEQQLASLREPGVSRSPALPTSLNLGYVVIGALALVLAGALCYRHWVR